MGSLGAGLAPPEPSAYRALSAVNAYWRKLLFLAQRDVYCAHALLSAAELGSTGALARWGRCGGELLPDQRRSAGCGSARAHVMGCW